MNNSQIERNSLDYILTDTLPYELPELYSLYPFYEYLLEKRKEIHIIKNQILKEKSKNNYLFENGSWSTTPLKFKISKGNSDKRIMSLLNPLSIVSIYFFIEIFQKELLIQLKEKNHYSLRYHTKNTNLYYKRKSNKRIEYFYKNKRNTNKSILQQTGIFYKIQKYNSINEFTNSKEWNLLNFKYKYFSSIDYKACFDSIYSHSFKWIILKDVIDSKSVNNSNLFVTIDKLSQNINAKSSNGLPVGPEFSRMIAELLLQEIDKKVKFNLEKNKIIQGVDYDVFRYVDDIFIFAVSELLVDQIIENYRDISSSFNLGINELKIVRKKTPFITSLWINRTRNISDSISNLFNKTKKINIEPGVSSLLKDGFLPFDRYLDEIKSLICDFPENKKQITSYLLSTIYNLISKKKEGYSIFSSNNINKFSLIIEMVFYIFSYHVSYDHAQKLLSIISYINNEIDLINNEKNNDKLQKIINNYSFIFLEDTISDISNLIIMLSEYKLKLPTSIEESLEKKIFNENNPMHLAILMIYSQYNKKYAIKIREIIQDEIMNQIDELKQCKQVLLHSGFWFLIIFINCRYINESIKAKMRKYLTNFQQSYQGKIEPAEKIIYLLCEFMLQKKLNLFFTWGYTNFSLTNQIAFKTYQRTIFKNYRKNKQLGYMGSLND